MSKKYPSIGNDLKNLVKTIEKAPYSGTIISDQVYKVRFAIKSKGKGKSKGGRVILYLNIPVTKNKSGINLRAYLLAVYDKSTIENIPSHIIDSLIRDNISDVD